MNPRKTGRVRNFWPAIVLLGLCCLTIARCTYNTATGRSEFIFISTGEEIMLGQSVHGQILSEYKLSTDAAKLARVQRVGQRVAQVSDRQDYAYQFYLIEKDEFNAFTVPGGSVYIFTGLLDRLKNDDEIAAVLAHEVGHCSAKHTIKKFQAALGYQLLGSIVMSQVEMGEMAAQVASMSSDAVMQLVFSAYGRQDELEADKLGLKYMNFAGYDMNAMISTFELLKKESKGPEVPTILRTHPHLDDRIAAVKEEIERIRKE